MQNKEILKLTNEQSVDALMDDLEGFDVVEDEQTGSRRWSSDHRVVIRRSSDQAYFAATYSRGLTESQDERPFEYDGDVIEWEQVFPVEKTIVVYE